QSVPCRARPDRHEAFGLAQEAIAEMLPGFWSLSQRVPSAKAALLRAANLAEADFAAAVETLRAGGQPADALDARFVAAFAIAGTADDCLAQARRYRAAGAGEPAPPFVGPPPGQGQGNLRRAHPPRKQREAPAS